MAEILHENWREYTEEEIIAIQEENCRDCKYHRRSCDMPLGSCDYIGDTGRRRGCRIEVCDKKIVVEKRKSDKKKLVTLPLGTRSKSYLEV